MFNHIPHKCPDCGAKVFEQNDPNNLGHCAIYMEVVDEGGGTIGYEVYCHNCGRNIEEDDE